MAVQVFTKFLNFRSIANVDINTKAVLSNIIQRSSTNQIRSCTLVTNQDNVNQSNELDIINDNAGNKRINKAMKAYLQKAYEYEELMKREIAEFNVGKRYLANMMGQDPENFTDEDVNDAIRYLFPSGLFEPKARPFMHHPSLVHPSRKEAEFDLKGRPHHFLFYTNKSGFYNILYDYLELMRELDALEDRRILKGKLPEDKDKIDLSDANWISKQGLEEMLKSKVHLADYEYLITAFERLVAHPYSVYAKDFLEKFVVRLTISTDTGILPILYDENKRPYITVENCMRKSSRGTVTVRGNGSGEITINGENILYFKHVQWREQWKNSKKEN